VTEENFDVYQGVSWTERARYGVFGVALDYGDKLGKKNAFIDGLHQQALSSALARLNRRFDRALDFGCGGGRLLPLLTRNAREAYGVDRTPECIEMARAAAVIPQERVQLWRDGPLPFEDAFFELFLSVYVLLRTVLLDALLPELARVTRRDGIGLLLEQLDNSRGLTLDRYREAFERNHLALVEATAIRRSSGSHWLRLASKPACPPRLAKLLVRAELAQMKRRRHDARTTGYYDYLFVVRKL
jgi:SAM-dependent methyltransferase